jgi:hypothetical protein
MKAKNMTTHVLCGGFNREEYLEEFFIYYKHVLKVNTIKYFFNDNALAKKSSKQATEEICKKHGVIFECISVKHTPADFQKKICKQRVKELKSLKSNAWLLFVDVDEFLNCKGLTLSNAVKKTLSHNPDAQAIGFTQRIFKPIKSGNFKKFLVTELLTDHVGMGWKADRLSKAVNFGWPGGPRRTQKCICNVQTATHFLHHTGPDMDKAVLELDYFIHHYQIYSMKHIAEPCWKTKRSTKEDEFRTLLAKDLLNSEGQNIFEQDEHWKNAVDLIKKIIIKK